jgi:hypothetical protein
MYSTCLHCHHSLGRNDTIEHFPVGARLAFDSAKGRLWVVCSHCSRWNLTPIEDRWEAVEECEREFRRVRLRAQTDNVGLARLSDDTELIRIGSPLRPEFAAWRYGGVFRQRLHKRIAIGAGVGAAIAAGGLLVAGAPMIATAGPLLLTPFFHFGIATVALRGEIIGTKIIGEDGKALRVTRSNLDHTRLVADESSLRLMLKHSYGRQQLTGDRAVRALSTLLLHVNRGGGSTNTIADAAEMIADAGDPQRTIAEVAREAERRAGDFEERSAEYARAPRGRTMAEALRAYTRRAALTRGQWSNTPPANPGALYRLPRVHRLALEMALHESSEQFALEQELAVLERAWREAEEIAGIADHLLVPANVAERLER